MNEMMKGVWQILGLGAFCILVLMLFIFFMPNDEAERSTVEFKGIVTDIEVERSGFGSLLNPAVYHTYLHLDNGRLVCLDDNESDRFIEGEYYHIKVEGEGPVYSLVWVTQ